MIVDLRNNIIAQYKMNDNSADSVVVDTQGSNASYEGANTEDKSVEGQIKTALSFNGSTDYIDAGQTFQSAFQNSFSVNFWTKPVNATPASAEYWFGSTTGPTNSCGFTYLSSGIIFLYEAGGANIIADIYPNVLVEDVWQMMTLTVEKIDANTVRVQVYRNGEQIGDSGNKTTIMGNYVNPYDVYINAINQQDNDASNSAAPMDNFCLFDKTLSQDDIDFLYSNGNGTEQLYGVSAIDENSSPTLIYPVGGEALIHETIQIEWEEPFLLSRGGAKKIYWYEIFYSIDSASEDNRLWHHIADIPSGNSIFNWRIPQKIRSNNCRVGIRVVDNEGARTPMIMSADVFSIQNKILPSPAIFSPLGGERFFTYIPVVFDQDGLAGQFPKRAHYRVSYTSDSQESDWTCIGDNIPITTSETFLDVSNLVSADDYSLKFELIDGENSSQPFFVHNIAVNNLNFFKIDTVPPVGLISVRNNSEYIKDRDTIVELTAYDATTGVESFKITQKELDYFDDQGENIITGGPLSPMSNISSWRVVEADGVKLLQVSFVDFAGNEVEPVASEFFFRTYKNVDNREVTSLLVNKVGSDYDVWHAIGGTAPELYLNGISTVGAGFAGEPKFLPVVQAGGSAGFEERYHTEGLLSVDFTYNAASIPDRFIVESESAVLLDTGFISGGTTVNLPLFSVDVITVKVFGPAGTGWNFEMSSEDEYPPDVEEQSPQDRPKGEILSMAMYNEVLYLGENTTEAKGLLERRVGGQIESVYEIPTSDSSINSMVVFDGLLYLACQNGELYSFNGTTVHLENTFEFALNEIGTDGNLLYIFLENSADIYTAYKDIFGDLNYVKTTLE